MPNVPSSTSFEHRIQLQAQPGRGAAMAGYLRDLTGPLASLPGCLALHVESLPGDAWQLLSAWHSGEAREAFFAAPIVQEVFSGLLQAGVLASVCSSVSAEERLVAA